MTFNSAEFLFFFPLVFFVYALTFHRERWREAVLLLASYLFYMSWNWRYAGYDQPAHAPPLAQRLRHRLAD